MIFFYPLETNPASPLLLGDPVTAAWAQRAGGEPIYLCMPSVGELWHMIFASRKVAENRTRLLQFLSGFSIIPFEEADAVEFGQVQTTLKLKGRPIPQIDVQIAAMARCRNLTLLTADAHFQFVPNLRTENWLS
ncbi:MAG TPA: type II toxin-antitoxin system VapC family toxin [Tepidisphaeraceae bacterium]|nr:type II toxin-antitoxin system VapC family toxin [Tepidisphaeraceae bacterium]